MILYFGKNICLHPCINLSIFRGIIEGITRLCKSLLSANGMQCQLIDHHFFLFITTTHWNGLSSWDLVSRCYSFGQFEAGLNSSSWFTNCLDEKNFLVMYSRTTETCPGRSENYFLVYFSERLLFSQSFQAQSILFGLTSSIFIYWGRKGDKMHCAWRRMHE